MEYQVRVLVHAHDLDFVIIWVIERNEDILVRRLSSFRYLGVRQQHLVEGRQVRWLVESCLRQALVQFVSIVPDRLAIPLWNRTVLALGWCKSFIFLTHSYHLHLCIVWDSDSSHLEQIGDARLLTHGLEIVDSLNLVIVHDLHRHPVRVAKRLDIVLRPLCLEELRDVEVQHRHCSGFVGFCLANFDQI